VVSKAVLIHGLILMSRILVKTRIPEMSEATLEVVMGAEVVQVVHVVNVLIGEVVEVVMVSQTKMPLIMQAIGEMISHKPMSGIMKNIQAH